MNANRRYPHCGVELPRTTGWWGNILSRVLMSLSFLLVLYAGYLTIKTSFFRRDFTKDLSVSEIKVQKNQLRTQITGLLTNSGERSWSSVSVEVEYYDEQGVFLGEVSGFSTSLIPAKSKEHFSLYIFHPQKEMLEGKWRLEAKVASALDLN